MAAVPYRLEPNVLLALPRCVNIGNIVAPPSNYFELPATRMIDFVEDGFQLGQVTIISKGLLSQDEHIATVRQRRPNQAVIIWGHGYERSCPVDAIYDWRLPTWLSELELVGVRDYNKGYRWVPCASCMHPIFDEPDPGPTREVTVISYHKALLPAEHFLGLPMIHNCTYDFRWFIRQIRSAQTIVTNSYHATYFATLLQRRVVLVSHDPWDAKFGGLRFRHPIAMAKDWRAQVTKTRIYPEALGLCREANRAFYADVLGLIRKTTCGEDRTR